MSTRVAINGFGRIGRNTLRALYERGYRKDIEVVAINDLGDPSINVHLFQHDTVHGHFHGDATLEGEHLLIGEDAIRLLREPLPHQLPWDELRVDVVLECSGRFTDYDSASAHLVAGAQKVLVSAPCKGAEATLVYGVNDHDLADHHRVVSNASCTTNCLAPIAQVLHQHMGIEQGLMTTIHAYTNDQSLSDAQHSDPYRARAAAHSMIPTKTGAAAAIGLVLPELAGKLDGLAVRVPTLNVSMVDLTVTLAKETDVHAVNQLMQAAAQDSTVLAYNEAPLVSIDFNHSPYSSVFDAGQTRVNGRLLKVMAWYDNEWGFANRMLDNTQLLARALARQGKVSLAATA